MTISNSAFLGGSGGSGGGSLIEISSQTASASSTISFTGLSATYRQYIIELSDVIVATNAVSLYMRTSTNNGSSYDSGSTDYQWSCPVYYTNTNLQTYSVGDTQIILTSNATVFIANAANALMSGSVTIISPSSSSRTKINSNLVYNTSSTGANLIANSQGFGERLSNTAINAIQFSLSSGNITSGSFTLYGII